MGEKSTPQVVLVLVKPGTTLIRQAELAKKHQARIQVVASFYHPEMPRTFYAEEWPLRRAMIDQAPEADKNAVFRGQSEAIATHLLRNTYIRTNRVGNYALVYATPERIRSTPKGSFGIRGIGWIANDGTHVFDQIVSIDWVPEVN